MKKYFFVIVSCLFLASPNVYADTFAWVGVLSQVTEYDQDDFPGKAGYSIMFAQAFVSVNPPTDTVTLDSTPTGNGTSIPWNADYGSFLQSFSSPPIGSAWQTTYTFHSGATTGTLNLSACTIRELSIPQATISNGGKTISWAPVPNADSYRLDWYNIDPNTGLPVGGPLAKTGYLTDTSYTMINPPPSGTTLAVRINAFEECSATNELLNMSSLYKIDEVTDTPIPTLSEWGMIFLALIMAGSAIVVLRRRRTTSGLA